MEEEKDRGGKIGGKIGDRQIMKERACIGVGVAVE